MLAHAWLVQCCLGPDAASLGRESITENPLHGSQTRAVGPVLAAQFPEDRWDAIIAVCLSSAFHATKAALPGMLERKWGRVINTGSMHALVASPYKSAYNAAKHGIAGAAPQRFLLPLHAI